MFTGILAGITWALETVILGFALGMSPFVSTEEAILLAPFVSTFLHDLCSAVFMLIRAAVTGRLRTFSEIFRNRDFKWLVLSSAIGGPVGMSGYVLAVNSMGSAIGAVASAVYPAVGTVLACIFLKEKVRWYQWIFLLFALTGVYGLSGSSGLADGNFLLGLLGAAMCALGWGMEAVILAKCFRSGEIRDDDALTVRQSVSALIYGLLIMPLMGGWRFTAGLLGEGFAGLIGVIALAALCASVSYLLYYKTIARIGASRAMALNITYTAWAIVFTVLLYRDPGILEARTLSCASVVVICGILAAADFRQLFRSGGRN
ncbi:MAG: DMT family transporter [Clostridia bacterium]|nr:DMT family transporter [Clostridia bacterium]